MDDLLHFVFRIVLIASVLNCSTVFSDQGSTATASRQSDSHGHVFHPPFERLPISPDSYLTATEIIARHGYPFETHSVTTDDGYILQLHRIPRSNKSPGAGAKKVVLLQPGVADSSAAFVASQTDSLAYVLADKGYDVWLANSRGTKYSRKHVKLDPSQEKFWNFSYDEMGSFDFPASVDYILKVAKQDKLVLITHSMGAAVSLIGLVQHPELNSKIDVMIGLAPTSSFANTPNYYRIFFRNFDLIKLLWNTGNSAILTNEGNRRSIQQLLCEQTYSQATVCRELIFATFGRYPENLDLTWVPIFNGHWPSGTSLKVAAQVSQNYLAGGKFQSFDYGKAGNLKRYGTETPREYDLRKVTAAVHIFWAENDLAVGRKDLALLSGKLANLKGFYRVEDPKFTHWCFLYGNNAKQMVYDRILTLLPAPIPSCKGSKRNAGPPMARNPHDPKGSEENKESGEESENNQESC